MTEIIGPLSVVSSYQTPLEAHIAHLHHLSKSTSCEMILNSRFGYTRDEARSAGRRIASYIEQGLAFNAASRQVSARVRPVMQYYAYLNLAVATILTYRPNGADACKTHGVSDTTHAIKTLALRSRVLRVRKGAVPAFHSLLSGRELTGQALRIVDLLVALPALGTELRAAFNIDPEILGVNFSLCGNSTDQCRTHYSQLSAQVLPKIRSHQHATSLPRRDLEGALPNLVEHFTPINESGQGVVYNSKKHWANDEFDAAKTWHRTMGIQLINYGGDSRRPNGSVRYRWYWVPGSPILPTMSAVLMFSFFLSSVARYRPRLAAQLERSRLNILAQTFINEADGFVLPTFRNLLYAEEMIVEFLAHA